MVRTRSSSKKQKDEPEAETSPKANPLDSRRKLLLKNEYKEVDEKDIKSTIKKLPLGTRFSYFGVDKEGNVKPRGGGWLLANQDNRYFVLRSTAPYSSKVKPKFISFSVQFPNVRALFYKLRKNASLEETQDDNPFKIYFSDTLYKEFATETNRKKHLQTKSFEKASKDKEVKLIPEKDE